MSSTQFHLCMQNYTKPIHSYLLSPLQLISFLWKSFKSGLLFSHDFLLEYQGFFYNKVKTMSWLNGIVSFKNVIFYTNLQLTPTPERTYMDNKKILRPSASCEAEILKKHNLKNSRMISFPTCNLPSWKKHNTDNYLRFQSHSSIGTLKRTYSNQLWNLPHC